MREDIQSCEGRAQKGSAGTIVSRSEVCNGHSKEQNIGLMGKIAFKVSSRV
jgi:hypothetical protein